MLTQPSTAILWDVQQGGVKVQQFVGHQYPIWGITMLDDGTVVTGKPCSWSYLTSVVSGDRTIKLWDLSSGTLKSTVSDHNDCVRGVLNISGLGFVTCSNDG